MKQINKETKSSGMKQFKLNPMSKGNGLCLGALVNVNVTLSEKPVKEDSAYINYRGLHMPMLHFVFAGSDANKGRTYIRTFNAWDFEYDLTSNYPDQNWNVFSSNIKHYLEVFKGGELSDDDFAKLAIDDEKRGEEMVKEFKRYFDDIAKLFNNYHGKNKPIYKDDKGVPYPLWMKLLISIKGSHVNKGNPGFPSFVGDGIIEKYIPKVDPYIAIRPAKQESIEDKPLESKKPNSDLPIITDVESLDVDVNV